MTVFDHETLQKLLDNSNRIATLSTCSQDNTPNAAVFGSVQLVGDSLRIGSGENRSKQNLQHNPKAMLMVVVPGGSVLDYRGIRLYLDLVSCEESGPDLDEIREQVTRQAGRAAARMIRYALTFRIVETRPLVDLFSLPKTD